MFKDVSGGYSSSILDAVRCALHTSKAVWFKKNGDPQYIPLTLHEVLYMATVGGAKGTFCVVWIILHCIYRHSLLAVVYYA